MNMHQLQDRTEKEMSWWTRRDFLNAIATWSALGSFAVHAQEQNNVVSRVGDVLINDKPIASQQAIKVGDTIHTGPGSALVVVMGKNAFQLRSNTKIAFDGNTDNTLVKTLRIIQGGVVSVWGKGEERRISTPTMVAGIRGTGVYTEVFEKQDSRSYFCTCYGSVELFAGTEQKLSSTNYHEAFWAEPQALKGKYFTPAKMLNHSDNELEYLAQLVQQKTAWQLANHKSVSYGEY